MKDDLRARTDFFNSRIWLDESASKVGRAREVEDFCRLPLCEVAGGVWQEGSSSEGKVEMRGRRCRESALLGGGQLE